MKPRLLTMQAFGPYRSSETIDFSELGDNKLFLIHGETGAGKTSILDGMVFALYGNSSGGERVSEQMRCDAAPPDLSTSVSFEFDLGEKRYRITRSPRQDLAAKRGSGLVTKAPEASLVEVTSSGDKPLATKTTDVNAHVKELIGFSSEQFRQVVVLPQGRFRDLLSAGSDKREEILKQLFQTGLYGAIERSLAEKAKGVRKAQDELNVERRTILEGARIDDAEALAKLESELGIAEQEARNTMAAAEKSRKDASGRLGAASEHVAALKALAEASKRAEDVAKNDDLIGEATVRLEAGRRAGLADAERAALHSAATGLAGARDRRVESEALVLSATTIEVDAKKALNAEERKDKARKTAVSEVSRLEGLAVAFSEWESSVRSADSARDRLNANEGLSKAAVALEAAMVDGDAAIALLTRMEKLDEVRVHLTKARSDAAAAAESLADAESLSAAARKAEQQAESAWRAGRAAALAGTLAAGEPCPVCGSLEHPHPARQAAGAVDDEALRLAKLASEGATSAEAEARDASGQAVLSVATLEAAESAQSGELGEQSKMTLEQARLASAQSNSEVERLRLLVDPLGDMQEQLTDVDAIKEMTRQAEAALMEAKLAAATATGTAETLGAAIPEQLRGPGKLQSAAKEAAELVSGLQAAYEAAREHYSKAREGLAAAKAGDESALSGLNEATALEVAAVGALERKTKELGYASLDALLEALLDPAESQSLARTIADHQKAQNEAKGAIAQAQMAIDRLDTKGDLPDIDELSRADAETAEALKQAVEALTRVESEIVQLKEVRARLSEVETRQKTIESEYQVIGRLAEVANGQLPGAKVSFQRWVLGTYLDQVLAAATCRLYEMSKGRFQLMRDTANTDGRRATGLDLAVFDEYSGTSRPAATLSGGESFLAALSLALGLAETVQELSGGTRLDTIFIDEGFGALDPDALDKAMDALLELEGSGRLVGVISHVPELRQVIAARLEVTGGSGGSATRFHVP